MSNEGANKGKFFFVVGIKFLRYASVWKNASVIFLSVSWTVILCFGYVYEEGIKGGDKKSSFYTDYEGMCVLVWYFIIFLCLYFFSNIYIMLVLFNCWNNTTEKKLDTIKYNASKGTSTPPPHPNKWSSR